MGVREHAKPSKVQLALLEEIRDAGVLFIRRGSRWERSVRALEARGLVRVVENDPSKPGWGVV